MNRRKFLQYSIGGLSAMALSRTSTAASDPDPQRSDRIINTEQEWQKLLTPEQYRVLRKEGTEKPFSSPLNDEKREGTYVCAGCELPLFSSDLKYDSGTGWPSFYDALPNSINTKKDYYLIFPRTEYHCARCGGHQGHVFDDGPQPTGLRYCNNGVALHFMPKTQGQP